MLMLDSGLEKQEKKVFSPFFHCQSIFGFLFVSNSAVKFQLG